MREIMRAGKDQTKRVHVADTMTNHASGSLRDTSSQLASIQDYITRYAGTKGAPTA